MLAAQAPDYEVEVSSLARVVESPSAIQLAVAGAKKQQVATPTALLRVRKQPVCVVRANGGFESVRNDQVRNAGCGLPHSRQSQMVAVRSRYALEPVVHHALAPDLLAPDRGEMRSGQPPCWAKGSQKGSRLTVAAYAESGTDGSMPRHCRNSPAPGD